MGSRVIKWSKRSVTNRDSIATWYMQNIGNTAVSKFLHDLNDTALRIADMPTIGMIDEICSTALRTYYSIQVHPLYRLIYRYTSKTIYIVGIRCNLKKTKFC